MRNEVIDNIFIIFTVRLILIICRLKTGFSL